MPPDPAPARAIIVEAVRRASRAGESHEMAARWAMEDLAKAGWKIEPVEGNAITAQMRYWRAGR